VKANKFDFLGEMDLELVGCQNPPAAALGHAVRVDRLAAVALPKGQPKMLDSVLFVPQNARQGPRDVQDQRARRRGRHPGVDMALTRMPSYQYHFVVLARIPEQYRLSRPRWSCSGFKPLSAKGN